MKIGETERVRTILDLSILYSKINFEFDEKNYDAIFKHSCKLLKVLGVANGKGETCAKIIKEMYVLSDIADNFLKEGNKKGHNMVFLKIRKRAKDLDKLLNITDGSINDEIDWWYHFRLARSQFRGRKPGKIRYFSHATMAFLQMIQEHYKRIGNLANAILCSFYLSKGGIEHAKDDWDNFQKSLFKYWHYKIAGNKGKIEEKMILV